MYQYHFLITLVQIEIVTTFSIRLKKDNFLAGGNSMQVKSVLS